MEEITIYTDGSSRGNPGPGGYAAVLIYEKHRKEIAKGYRLTTNNRMELLAVISGISAVKTSNEKIIIYSDSQYICNAVNKGWLKNWLKIDFKGKKNKDLWLKFWEVYQNHRVTLKWVKGHAGNKENERCDELATRAAQRKVLEIDLAYEKLS